MNPVLPLQHKVPDVEARVFDQRLYFYGSYDDSLTHEYCSPRLHVFSTDDMQTYHDHGIALDTAWFTGPDLLIYAPDCIRSGDAYHLVFATSDGREWIARSQSPCGPFRQVSRLTVPWQQIDPALLLDDDGQVYYYWGQFACHCAKMNPDMLSVQADTAVYSVLDEHQHGFHEGASIRKIDGRYYLVYADISRGRATCLSYAVSDYPDRGFEKGGVIIDCSGCDRESWNNHGSLVKFKEQWYICYHRSSAARTGQRRLCLEPVHYRSGHFQETEMTVNGPQPPLDPCREMEAVRACLLQGSVRADRGGQYLERMENGSSACFRYFRFHGEDKLTVRCASLFADCTLLLRLGSACGPVLARIPLRNTGGWLSGGIDGFHSYTAAVQPIHGDQAIYFTADCRHHRSFSFASWHFGHSG